MSNSEDKDLTNKEKVKAGLVILTPFLVLFAILAYQILKREFPHHKVGECLKVVDTEANDCEEATYSYIEILAAGKNHYKTTRYYYSKVLNGALLSYDEVREFVSVDEYETIVGTANCDVLDFMVRANQ